MNWPTEVILSCMTGILMCKIDDLYKILNYMTHDNLYSHQLPRAASTCRPHLVEQHPWLADCTQEKALRIGWLQFLNEQIALHGAELNVESLPEGVWEKKNPFAELSEMMNQKQKLKQEMEK